MARRMKYRGRFAALSGRSGEAASANGHKKTRRKAGFFESEEAKST